MSEEAKKKRVAELVQKARTARRQDANQEAADAVKEALSINPDDEEAQKLFEGLSLAAGKPVDVLKLCEEFYDGRLSETSFRGQLDSSSIDIEGTRETIEFAFARKGQRGDTMVECLLSKPNGKRAFIPLFLNEPTRTFKALWDLGEYSLGAVINKVLLQPGGWSKAADRDKAEKDMLYSLLSKMLQAGIENPELAMLSIARLLAYDVAKLQSFIDSDAYMVFFDALNVEHSTAMRAQATLTLAKLHEVNPDHWEKELVTYVDSMAKSPLTDNVIRACSAVGSLFPVAPPICARMFLKEGFVQQLMHLVNNTENAEFKEAALELVSAACVDSTCRQTVQKHCKTWLSGMAVLEDSDATGSKLAVTAALANAKIRDDDSTAGQTNDKLIVKLKSVILDQDAPAHAVEKAVEGLQYQSVHAKIKENLVSDNNFLNRLIAYLSQPEVMKNGALVHIGLNIFQNLTRYPPVVSPEQQKMAELKAYANKTPLPKVHSLDEDGPVSERCARVLNAGIAPLLITATKRASLALHLVISSIVLSLSKHPRHRGRAAKDGLLDLSMTQASIEVSDQRSTLQVKRQASLSFARILIPLDPQLSMRGRDVRAAIRILLYLMKTVDPGDDDMDARWWRGYPLVSALQALTNLASYQPSPSNPFITAEVITNECWSTLEDLWTSEVLQVRTAATQCFCNLCSTAPGATKFLSDGPLSKRRMKILAGYWSEEAGNIALAAGGGLATLLGCGDLPIELFLKTESGVQSTLEWIQSDKPDLVHRAVVIVGELLVPVEESKGSSPLAKKVLARLKQDGIEIALKDLGGAGRSSPWEEHVDRSLEILRKYCTDR